MGLGDAVQGGLQLVHMNELWKAPSSVGALVKALRGETGWSKSTVFIMLSRLIEKGAVACDDAVSPKLYSALISREGAALSETRSFLGRVYGGSLGSMMSCMAANHELSREEIDELVAILRRAEEEVGGDG